MEVFKGCLRALDGTHLPVQVPAVDRPRYRNRKGRDQQWMDGCYEMQLIEAMV